MNILSELNALMDSLGIKVETGVFSETAPDVYTVITPLIDTFQLFSDNQPGWDMQEARISLFCKSNYLAQKNMIVRALQSYGFTITARQYISHEDDTGYHNYAIDAAKLYAIEE